MAAVRTGNPSALHSAGRIARSVLEDARESVAAALGAESSEVLFTSGGSEANSIALLCSRLSGTAPAVMVGAVEHPSVVQVAKTRPGAGTLSVDRDGVVELQTVRQAIDAGAGLLSLQLVNNETGTLQLVREVVQLARPAGVLVHTDAVQGPGHVPTHFDELGVDLMSISAHKFGGPVGVGALLARRELELAAWGLGGGQERQVRSGTPPTMLAAGMAVALRQATAELPSESIRLASLRGLLVDRLRASVDGVFVNGGDHVSPAICNVTFTGTRADDLLLLLDQRGYDCSTGSACRAGLHKPSEVLLAMGRSLAEASSSIRFSFGPSTQRSDIDSLLDELPDVVSTARAALNWHIGMN